MFLLLIHIFLGFALSFIGSLPFGIINMTVADTAIKRGFKAGLIIGFGAAFVEFFQAIIAIKFTQLFLDNPTIETILNIIATIVFFSFAVYYLFFAKIEEPITFDNAPPKVPGFIAGMLISASNVVVFPYWILYSGYLSSIGWMRIENIYIFAFSIGVALGGVALFALYAKLGTIIVKRGMHILQYINRFIGGVFLFFFLYQIWVLYLAYVE